MQSCGSRGSVILDGGLNGMARGHVSVKATPAQIKEAVIGKTKIPKPNNN